MHVISKVVQFIASLNNFLGKLSSYCLLLCMFILSYEVFVRYFLNNPTIWAHEITGYFLTVYLALSGPWVLLNKEHVNVDILYSRYSYKTQNIMDIFSYIITIFFFVILLKTSFSYFWYSFITGQTSHTTFGAPLWIAKSFIPFTAVLFILQALANICDSALKLKEYRQ